MFPLNVCAVATAIATAAAAAVVIVDFRSALQLYKMSGVYFLLLILLLGIFWQQPSHSPCAIAACDCSVINFLTKC